MLDISNENMYNVSVITYREVLLWAKTANPNAATAVLGARASRPRMESSCAQTVSGNFGGRGPTNNPQIAMSVSDIAIFTFCSLELSLK